MECLESGVLAVGSVDEGGRERNPGLPSDDLMEVETERTRSLHLEARRLNMRPADLDVFIRAGLGFEQIPTSPVQRASMLAYLRKHETPPPKWIVISALFPEQENGLDAVERRKRLRALHSAVVLLIRRELKRHEVDEFRAERSVFWDPVAEVCRELEISQSALSRLCKEFSGNSLVQTVDLVRAESLRPKLGAGIRVFLASAGQVQGSGDKVQGSRFEVQGFGDASTKGTDGARGATFVVKKQIDPGARDECVATDAVWAVWKGLRDSRKWPAFCQNTWAQELGFASYRRLYRACLVLYRKTPYQLEMELIAECLGNSVPGSGFDVPGLKEVPGSGFKVPGFGAQYWALGLGECERMVRAVRGYCLME